MLADVNRQQVEFAVTAKDEYDEAELLAAFAKVNFKKARVLQAPK